jgi:hypothetical protein
MDQFGDHASLFEMLDEFQSIDLCEIDEWRGVENPHSQCLKIRAEMVIRHPGDIALFGKLREIPDGHSCQVGGATEGDCSFLEFIEYSFALPLLKPLRKEFSNRGASVEILLLEIFVEFGF